MLFDTIVDFLKEISRYSALPGILFFLFVSFNRGQNTRIAFYILLASFLADFSNYFFIRYVYPNSFIISNAWYLLNYVIVSFLFYNLLRSRRKLILAFGSVFLLGSILSFLAFYSFLDSNTFIRTYSSLIFTVLSLLTFFEILKESPTNKLASYPVFWIVTAIFLYSSITLIRNLFLNYLIFEMQISRSLSQYILIFNLSFNIAKNLMIFYAFLLAKKGFPDHIHQPKPVTP